jgi:hypothetical protein
MLRCRRRQVLPRDRPSRRVKAQQPAYLRPLQRAASKQPSLDPRRDLQPGQPCEPAALPYHHTMASLIACRRYCSKTSAADCLRLAKLRKFAGYSRPSIYALFVPGSSQFFNSALYDTHRSFAVPSAARPSIDERGLVLADVHDARKLKCFMELAGFLTDLLHAARGRKNRNPSRTGRYGWSKAFRRGSVTEVPPQEFTTSLLQAV